MTSEHPEQDIEREGQTRNAAAGSSVSEKKHASTEAKHARAAEAERTPGEDRAQRARVEKTRLTGALAAEAVGTRLTGALAAEAVGTLLLVMVGLGTGTFATNTIDAVVGFGLALVIGIVAFGHVSGGHFNPAVTMGVWLAGRISAKDAVLYLVAQVVGGIAGAGLLFLTVLSMSSGSITSQAFGKVSNGFDTLSQSHAPVGTVLLVEVILTALFVAVILGATSRKAAPWLAPLAIGAALTVFLTIASPFDGGSLNPARSLASAVFADGEHLAQVWVFWVAPLVGGAVAGIIYRAVDRTTELQDGLRETFEEPEVLEAR